MYVKVEKVFTCPRCGGHRLEEVMHSVIQSSPVLDIEVEDEGEESEAHIVEYGDATFDGGVVSHYQCLGCGEELKCEPDDQSLYEYLKEMQKGQSSKNEAVASTKLSVKENRR